MRNTNPDYKIFIFSIKYSLFISHSCVSGCPHLAPNTHQLFRVIIAVRSNHISVAMRSRVHGLLEVKLVRVQWPDPRLEGHQSQVNIIKSAKNKSI